MDQLEGRLDNLAQAFTARVRQIPEYGESQVTVLEIRDTARETFRRLIHGLRAARRTTAGTGCSPLPRTSAPSGPGPGFRPNP